MKKVFFSFPQFNFNYFVNQGLKPVYNADKTRAVIRVADDFAAFFFEEEGFRISGTKEEVDNAVQTHLSGGVIVIEEQEKVAS